MNIKKDSNTKISFLLVLAILSFNLASYFSHSIDMKSIFNADALYLMSLFKDLIIDNGSYSSWYLTPAPYFFPDMAIYFIINSLIDNIYYTIPVFFSIQLLITIYLLYKLYSHFFEKKLALYYSVINIAFIEIFLFHKGPYFYSLSSAHHYGEFLLGIAFIYLSIETLIENLKKHHLIFLSLITIASTASDKLFIVHFIIPAIATILFLTTLKLLKLNNIRAYLVSVFIFLGIGLISYEFTIPNPPPPVVNFSYLNIFKILNYFDGTYDLSKFHISLFMLLLGGIPATIYLTWKYRSKAVKKPKELFLFTWLIFHAYIGFIIIISSSHSISLRYFIPFFYFIVFLIPVVLKFKYSLTPKAIGLSMIALILISFTLITTKLPRIKNDYYPEYIACIDDISKKTGAITGAAQYWQAKQITMLSKENILVAQAKPDLSPYNWISNSDWNRKQYDFVVIDHNANNVYKIREHNLYEKLGKENKQFDCHGSTVYYYR